MSGNPVSTSQATMSAMRESRKNVWTGYDLGSLLFNLYIAKKYRDSPLQLRKPHPSLADYNRLVSGLLDGAFIEGIERGRVSKPAVFRIATAHAPAPEEIACAIDPFAYISHLSAMRHWKLTETVPTELSVSSLSDAKWKAAALRLMKELLSEHHDAYIESGLPVLRRLDPGSVKGMEAHRHPVSDPGGFKRVDYGRVRVASVGRTFLDMLRQPELCGGMPHVIDVFREKAGSLLNPIIDEVERSGTQIDKVRAGYILEECCGLTPDVTSDWVRHAQRGGSRKLDPSREYAPRYSERWCLSLNV